LRKFFLQLFSQPEILQFVKNFLEKIDSTENDFSAEEKEICDFWAKNKIDEKIENAKNPRSKIKNFLQKKIIKTRGKISMASKICHEIGANFRE